MMCPLRKEALDQTLQVFGPTISRLDSHKHRPFILVPAQNLFKNCSPSHTF